MPTARELYAAGRLDSAIETLGAELRNAPTDAHRRTFLFELLSFAGQYDRAEKQLDVLARDGTDAELAVLPYRAALQADRIREHMFLTGDFPAGVVPTPSTSDIETSITWTEKGELLPTVESYAVIAAGEGEGVKAGDLFELVRATEQGAEERLAIARVLRVGPLGSSVILTKQWRAGIVTGVKARRVAKMP